MESLKARGKGRANVTAHTERFTGRAADYAQFRERYEPELVLPVLREWFGLMPDWRVADVGAGTGMAGDLFRANGNPVIAIEPNAEMRSLCSSLHVADPLFTVVEGSAEATGLPRASVDMIAVGRALHWFDVDAALREFRRILKPGGWVAILACGRDQEGREENLSFRELLRAQTGLNVSQDPLLAVYSRLPELFPGGCFFHAEVPGEMQLGWEELRGLALSLSHSPAPDSPAFPAFEAELLRFFDRFAQDGRIAFMTRTWINAGQFAD